MNTVRRTISLPAGLAADLEEEARARGLSFSALIAEKVARGSEGLLSIRGIIDDDPDLSLKIEEILQRAFREES